MKKDIEPVEAEIDEAEDDRRGFLKSCGKFAVTVPPVVTMLLSTSLTSEALAKSTGETGSRGKDYPRPKTDTGIKRNQDVGRKFGH